MQRNASGGLYMSNHKNTGNINVDEKDIIRGFIATASMGLSSKEEVVEKFQFENHNFISGY